MKKYTLRHLASDKIIHFESADTMSEIFAVAVKNGYVEVTKGKHTILIGSELLKNSTLEEKTSDGLSAQQVAGMLGR